MRFGPNDSLKFIGFHINTWKRWTAYMLFIATVGCMDTWIYRYVYTYFFGRIYLEDVVVTEFARQFHYLWGLGTATYLSQNIRLIFTTLITISQFDAALWNVLARSSVTAVVSYRLLTDKWKKKKWEGMPSESGSTELICQSIARDLRQPRSLSRLHHR